MSKCKRECCNNRSLDHRKISFCGTLEIKPQYNSQYKPENKSKYVFFKNKRFCHGIGNNLIKKLETAGKTVSNG
jgi:hypothetical protein